MLKVLFLNPPHKFRISRCSRWPEHTKSGTLYFPYWLAYAAGVSLEKGHEVSLLDAIAKNWSFEKTLDEIKKFNPDLIVLETVTPTFFSDMRFVSFVKQNIDTKLCLVGTHVSVFPKKSLRESKADYVAIKEYDYTVLDLLENLNGKKDLKDIEGIAYKEDDDVFVNKERELLTDMDSLPFVSKVYKKFLDIEDYRYSLARHPMVQIWSARGCPNMCTFCQYPQVFSGRCFRSRSPENFVDELEWVKKNLPQVKEIFVEDDTMTIDKERIIRICDLIRERNLKIVWSANLRADVPYEVLKKMKESGFRMAIVGYESGNQEVLNNIRKGVLLERTIKFTEDCKKLGIKIFGCFMVGLPGETRETVYQTLDYAKRLNPDMAFFQHSVPFPGTRFYEWAKKENCLVTEDWDEWLDENGRLGFLIDCPEMSRKKVRELRDEITKKFYTNPKWIGYALTHNIHPYEMVRMIKAGVDYFKFLVSESD